MTPRQLILIALIGISLNQVATCYRSNLVYERPPATPCWSVRDIWDELDNSDAVDDRFAKSDRPQCDDEGNFK